MGLFTRIKRVFIKRKPDFLAPEGVCPNCWGRQAWDQRFYRVARDKQIDVNNKTAKHAFIQDFVATHLDGIRLKQEREFYHCPECNRKYHKHK